ncbi:MAG: type IX secretion system membrane protein PorP/SprF [Flavobacteriales bacterium]|nr:type IX secretion system membrane protein PorP/SprF [Flavobacteriales bacterium]MEB2342322.1 type IX secretion system membrane protein PorP/SprF [Flavobacteriia bacterium]
MSIWTGRRVALGLVISLFGGLAALAQDPQFTQFYANPLYLNPAFAGTARCPRVALNYRNQWPALSGTFVTTSASYDQDVRGIMGGLGLLVTSDQAGKGTLNTTTVSGIYSYTQAVSRKFSIKAGFQATYFQKSLDWNKLTFGDQIDPRRGFIYATNDVPRGGKVGNADFSAGILGYTDVFFVGFAAHHLTEPNESLIVGTSKMPMKLTAHAGAAIPMGMRGKYGEAKTKLSPNILYQQQAAFRQLNLGMYVDHGPIMAGIWYRSKDAFIALIGFHTEHLKFGYSYDVTTSKLTTATAGSHEVSVTLQFDCKKKRRRVRTVPCPVF